jgi:hypothetical protein
MATLSATLDASSLSCAPRERALNELMNSARSGHPLGTEYSSEKLVPVCSARANELHE